MTEVLLSHPRLKAIDLAIQTGATGIELAQQKYRPQWGINARYGHRQDDPAGPERADFFSLGLSFELPLFTANRQDQDVRSAIAQREAMVTDRVLVLRSMRKELLTALSDLNRLDERERLYTSRLLQQFADQAEASLNAYTNDRGDFADVMRARIAALNAQVDYLDIRARRLNALMRINYFMTADSWSANARSGT